MTRPDTTKADVGDVQAALAYAHAAATTEHHPAGVPTSVVVTSQHDDRRIVVEDLERTLPHPRRMHGSTTLHDADSFAEWVKRHHEDDEDGSPYVDIYSTCSEHTITAVLNPGRAGVPDWGDYIGRLALTLHRTWVDWCNIDRVAVTQETFAEFVIDNASSFVDPTAADMLEIAETLTLNVGATISSAVRQRDGNRRLVFNEDTTAKAGHDREVEVPEVITLRCPIYDGAAPVTFDARLQVRRTGTAVGFRVVTTDPDAIAQRAFDAIEAEVADRLEDFRIYRGRAR